MPKLTKDSLEKRFLCQYCGESFRTRQGLSGHIQWKHKDKHATYLDLTIPDAGDLMLMKAGYEQFGLSDSKLKAILDSILWWDVVKAFCKLSKIKLNQQDLKNYVIASLAHIQQT